MKKLQFIQILFLFSLIWSNLISSQNTVGIVLNNEQSLNGYTLFTVQKDTYLINNCGEVIHQWTSTFNSGKSVYLLENGNLLRAAQIPNPGNIAIPGVGGRIELFNWDGDLIWGYDFTTSTSIQHHDIFPMPNGNVLVLAAKIINETDAINQGRNPINLTESKLYGEYIVELEPIGADAANVVWQWEFKDHLIQNFDNTKINFGIIADNPQLLDINYLGISSGNANWLHVNSMQYNATLDQILLSSRHLSEIYIIDHSTTTAEAATSSGGLYNKGGDLLYRWGNPITYAQGTTNDQKLFGQHYPHWIANGLVDSGKILIFNNGLNRTPNFSQIDIINPPISTPGTYTYVANSAYGPINTDYTYTASNSADFFSPILSSAQRLPNGNTLICEGTSGHFFEIDSNEAIVWEYINPVGVNGIMTQGDDPEVTNNNIFRVKKYATDYAAFNGKILTPGSPIELNPDLSQCSILSVSDNKQFNLSLYPNPVDKLLNIKSKTTITKVEFFNQFGSLIKTSYNRDIINITHLKSGIYMVKLFSDTDISFKKIIKL